MNKRKILILAANPQGTDQLHLDKEIKAIEQARWDGTERNNFEVVSKLAVKTSELQAVLRREKPRIVHFCGHGAGKPGLVFNSDQDTEQFVSTQGITALFKKHANTIECVVLNACYSKVQGEAINQHINYVIGTKRAIRDDAAIAFSKGFYGSLADGESIASAMEDGRARIQLDIYDGKGSDRKLVPVYDEIEEEWRNIPEHKVLTLLTKEQLTEIPESVIASNNHKNNQAATAFDILRELIEEVPLIRTAVIQFRTEFAAISEQLEMLATYKDLHDLLHNLEFKCYQVILREARHFPEDYKSISALEVYGQNLADIIADTESIIVQNNAATAGITWHQKLTQALELLQTAIEDEDKRTLRKAIFGINRIIASEPIQINQALVSTSKVLRLPFLVEAMNIILKQILDSQLDSPKIDRFKDSVASLSKLDEVLKIIICTHDCWQKIDVQLRRIETVTANTSDLFELEMSWSDLKIEVAEQYRDSQEKWAIALQKSAARLDEAIAQNSPRIKEYFSSYRSGASQRFYKVDLEFKNFCGNLREVGKPLAYLLEMLA